MENISNHFTLKKSELTLIACSRNSIIGFLIAQRIIDSFEINSFYLPIFRERVLVVKLLGNFIKIAVRGKLHQFTWRL